MSLDCERASSCQLGALRANGTPLVEVIAETCGVGETCDGPGVIDVCGTILEQGPSLLEATVNCTGDDASNYYTDAMCGGRADVPRAWCELRLLAKKRRLGALFGAITPPASQEQTLENSVSKWMAPGSVQSSS